MSPQRVNIAAPRTGRQDKAARRGSHDQQQKAPLRGHRGKFVRDALENSRGTSRDISIDQQRACAGGSGMLEYAGADDRLRQGPLLEPAGEAADRAVEVGAEILGSIDHGNDMPAMEEIAVCCASNEQD